MDLLPTLAAGVVAVRRRNAPVESGEAHLRASRCRRAISVATNSGFALSPRRCATMGFSAFGGLRGG